MEAGTGGRILGVDVGAARTGLALSDPLGVTCSPLEVVGERDQARLIGRILEMAASAEVAEIVVGLPIPLRGGTNAQLESVEGFVSALSRRTHLPVRTWDERFTSKLAERGRTTPGPADAVAACHMLQGYLDAAHIRRLRAAETGERA